MPDSEAVPMLDDVNHADMFNSAIADEPAEPAPQPETQPEPAPQETVEADPRVDATGRHHGADGRFVSPQAPADAAPIQQQPVTEIKPPQSADDREGWVPSWRLREVNESADRRITEEVDRRVREHLARQPQQQPQPQVEIDPLTDPQGYQRAITDHFEQQRARDRLDFNLQLARVRHGDKFDEAFQAFMQEADRNPHFGQAVVRSSDPGGTLWQWYQGQTILREVGTDPTAYRQKLRDELLKDPAFQAEVIKAVNGAQASQQPGARPNNLTQLPPSLSRASGSTANTTDEMPTGQGLFEHALRG